MARCSVCICTDVEHVIACYRFMCLRTSYTWHLHGYTHSHIINEVREARGPYETAGMFGGCWDVRRKRAWAMQTV